MLPIWKLTLNLILIILNNKKFKKIIIVMIVNMDKLIVEFNHVV